MTDHRLELRRYAPRAMRRLGHAAETLMTGIAEETSETPEILDKSALTAAEALEEVAAELRARVARIQSDQ